MSGARTAQPAFLTPFASETRERPPFTKRRQRGAPWEARGGVFEPYVEHGGCPPGPAQRSRHGSIARCSRRSVRNAGWDAGTPVAFVRHSWPVSRRGDPSLFITRVARRRRFAFDISTRHSGFRLQCPLRAPWRLPDPPAIPLQINAIEATPTARGGASTHPTEFDTFRHFSTLLSNSVESPIPTAAFASCSHLTWGVSSRWERGCSRLALFLQKCFSHTIDYAFGCSDLVPIMMRSDDSGECPSPSAGRVSNGQGKHLDLARMFHLRSRHTELGTHV